LCKEFTMTTNHQPAGRSRAHRWAPLLATIAIAVAGAAAVAPLAVQAMPGGPGMMGGEHGGHFMGRMLERMLDKVGASEAQRTQIRQIAQLAQADMKAQMQAGQALRDQGLALMGAPTLDAVAVEALRQQMLARHDQASRRMLQAMLDIGNVLTPEQRAKLAEQMKQHRGMMMQHRMGAHSDHKN
jgi:Spy/CpxP family protein refolding chaperone